MNNSNKPVVVMTHHLPEDWIASLEGKCDLFIGPYDATQLGPELISVLPRAEGLFSLLTIPVNEFILEQAPKLRVVSNMAVGIDNIDVQACTLRNIPVGNTPGVLTESTADLTMAIMLACARKIPQSSLDARQGKWKTWSPAGWLGRELNGSILGIIGMGKIGKAVAKRAQGFGMRIIFTDPVEKEIQDATQVSLEELLRKSDIISLHAPLTPETKQLINQTTLSMMKPTSMLINAARGPLVDTAALMNALQTNKIAAAALDVTDPEPLPPTHPLYDIPNCLIVPHIGSATQKTRKKMAELACDNLLAGLRGKRLPHCVNPEVYLKNGRYTDDQT
jgi:lactate dehydrogenase-like 2-hydroxyacid dehydrogenase